MLNLTRQICLSCEISSTVSGYRFKSFSCILGAISKKPIEKISIKELTELACVNKSTFYRHYTDIYALSESIEDDLVESCMEMVAEPDKLLEKEGILSLINALDAQSNIFNIIFSGSRKNAAIHKIHYRFMKKLLAQHPEYQDDMEKKIMLLRAFRLSGMSLFLPQYK